MYDHATMNNIIMVNITGTIFSPSHQILEISNFLAKKWPTSSLITMISVGELNSQSIHRKIIGFQ